MRYYTASRDEHTERKVSPYHLYNVQGDWYLIAYDDKRQSFRNFAIGRMENWRVMNETFALLPVFFSGNVHGSAFHTERGGEVAEVVIRFNPQQARYMRRETLAPGPADRSNPRRAG